MDQCQVVLRYQLGNIWWIPAATSRGAGPGENVLASSPSAKEAESRKVKCETIVVKLCESFESELLNYVNR